MGGDLFLGTLEDQTELAVRDYKYREFVVQKNELIQRVRNNLTERELKLLEFMISQVTANDDQLYTIKTTISFINHLFRFGDGGRNLQLTREALMSMRRKAFWFRDEERKTTETVSWLDKVVIYDDGSVELRLDATLAPYLVGMLGGNFTQYRLNDIVNLKGKNTLLMYKLIQSHYMGNKMAFELEREDLLDYFNKSDMKWNAFNQKIITPTIKKINDVTIIHVDYEFITRGRKITKVRFTVGPFKIRR